MLTIALESEGTRNGCLIGERVDVEAEVVVSEKETGFESWRA
jgi:hypothetical protein